MVGYVQSTGRRARGGNIATNQTAVARVRSSQQVAWQKDFTSRYFGRIGCVETRACRHGWRALSRDAAGTAVRPLDRRRWNAEMHVEGEEK